MVHKKNSIRAILKFPLHVRRSRRGRGLGGGLQIHICPPLKQFIRLYQILWKILLNYRMKTCFNGYKIYLQQGLVFVLYAFYPLMSADSSSGTIRGNVYNFDRIPVADVHVQLENNSGADVVKFQRRICCNRYSTRYLYYLFLTYQL